MGICMNKEEEAEVREQPKNKNIQTQIESVDVVKMKLKQARDKIKAFVAKKQADVAQIDLQIKEKLPEYERTKNKKEIVPLLKAKKDLLEIVEKGDVRLRLVNDKLAEVELQQLNKEVLSLLSRPSMFWTIPTSTSARCRTCSRPRTGGTFWLRPSRRWRSSGLTIGRKSKRTQPF